MRYILLFMIAYTNLSINTYKKFLPKVDERFEIFEKRGWGSLTQRAKTDFRNNTGSSFFIICIYNYSILS